MKNVLILGSAESPFACDQIARLFAESSSIALVNSGCVRDATIIKGQVQRFCNAYDLRLVALSPDNIDSIGGLIICSGNPYLILHHLRVHNLFARLKDRIEYGLPTVAVGSGSLVLCESIITSMSMPLAELPNLEGLGAINTGLHAGDLKEHERNAFAELFTVYPEAKVLSIPSASALLLQKGRAQALGSIIRLMPGYDQHYNSFDYIHLD